MPTPNNKGTREETNFISSIVGKEEFSMGTKGPLATPWPKVESFNYAKDTSMPEHSRT